jgi:hypothetical protein
MTVPVLLIIDQPILPSWVSSAIEVADNSTMVTIAKLRKVGGEPDRLGRWVMARRFQARGG